ncbi:hypothetical protein NLU13_8590 [Sarocladium strictum]|uniref:Hypervirulence associated protein TUDOR domain-containing protein n=1 Tax=Sarocladium strictum TaxID=5046 RepID=A0AA39GDG8_SARSR|nr:hypothetical protein NLU13_8590 [Sarocladium strictum]
MKDSKDVIREFNEVVNMTASELEKWLKSDDSQSAGWPKENADGESVGHDSGRKIVEILKANPKKEPGKYTDEQVQHMRKVVSYCKRHLAQEEKSNNEKSAEEVKKTKSYASLKNWGHDPLKARGEDGDDKEEAEEEEEEKQAGNKRKKGSDEQEGANKKRETRSARAKKQNGNKSDEEEGDKGEDEDEDEDEAKNEEKGQGKARKSNGAQKNGQSKSKKDENGDDKPEEEEEEEEQEEDDDDNDENEESGDKSGAKTKKGPKKGDTVSWNWGSGQPQGKVLDVKPEKTTITTKRGNEVSRDGDPEDPAVVLDTGKSKAIKSAHELN